MAHDPYRRRIALDQVLGHLDDPSDGLSSSPPLSASCRAQIRVGRDLIPARLLSLDLNGLRCAANVVFPPATFLVLELDGQDVGVGAFEITGVVARSDRHEHIVTFYAADIVARERLHKLLFALRLRDEHWQRPAEVTRIVSALPTSSDELTTLRALVTQLAFERDEARRALAELKSQQLRQQLTDANSGGWLSNSNDTPLPPSMGVSAVMMAALHDDIDQEGDASDISVGKIDVDVGTAELAAADVLEKWKASRVATLDELQAEREVAYEVVRCDIDVTRPMAPHHRRRSPFPSQESVT